MLAILLIALMASLYSCTGRQKERITVAVSLPPQASLLRDIAGDSIDIVTLMETDANPESFEVTVNTLRKINDADIYLTTGNLPFEETLTDKISQSNKSLKFIDLSKGIKPIYGTHSHGSHSHSVADPHTWTSIANLKTMAANILEALIDIDPARQDYYSANFQRLTHQLDSIDASIASRLSLAPTKAFLIWHPSLSYYSRDYGINQIPLGQDNKEMTPGQLRTTHQQAANQGVKVMFIQQNYDASQAQNMAKELGLTVIQINPLDDDYLRQFNIITDALTR